MSERESGYGSFIVGIAAGVVLGLLFAPEPGVAFRKKLGQRLRRLQDLAAGKAVDLGELLVEATTSADGEGRRRRGRARSRPRPGEEDEPLE